MPSRGAGINLFQGVFGWGRAEDEVREISPAVALLGAVLASVLGGLGVSLWMRRRAAARVRPQPTWFDSDDPMAWLLEPREFERRLQGAVSLASPGSGYLSVIVARVTNYDEIAAALGDAGAELALERVAWTLRNALQDRDVVGRLGRGLCGVIMLRACPEHSEVQLDLLWAPLSGGAWLLLDQVDLVPIGVALGSAGFPEQGRSAGELIAAAKTSASLAGHVSPWRGGA